MKKHIITATILLALLATGCRFERIGNDLSAGVSKNTEAIGKNLFTGVAKGLSDSAFRSSMYTLVDSVTLTAGSGVNRSVKQLMDTLLSEKWIDFTRSLVEEATGQRLRNNIALLRTRLLGPETNAQVQALLANAMSTVFNDGLPLRLAALRDELTGPAMLQNVAALRDNLLGPATNNAIRAIVDSAMMAVAFRMKNDINPSLQDNLSFIQRNATSLLVVVGIIALVIIIVIWRLKEKYAKTTTVLASQINAIPDSRTYDELTSRIKDRATETGVEPTLRKVLKNNGLLGKASWDARQLKRKSFAATQN